jgi:hypothetical protein
MRFARAVLAAGALLMSCQAAGQQVADSWSSLLFRMQPADRELTARVSDATIKRKVTREDVLNVTERGLDYYRMGDFFSARELFRYGENAYSMLWWKRDEIYAKAAAYKALSEYKFCQKEPANCREYVYGAWRFRPDPELRALIKQYGDFSSALDDRVTPGVPGELKDELRQACAATHQRLRALCEANPAAEDYCARSSKPSCG